MVPMDLMALIDAFVVMAVLTLVTVIYIDLFFEHNWFTVISEK